MGLCVRVSISIDVTKRKTLPFLKRCEVSHEFGFWIEEKLKTEESTKRRIKSKKEFLALKLSAINLFHLKKNSNIPKMNHVQSNPNKSIYSQNRFSLLFFPKKYLNLAREFWMKLDFK